MAGTGDGSVEIRITGSVDASVAASAAKAKAAMADVAQGTVVSSKAMADALKATGGDLSKVTPAMLGLGQATTMTAAATDALASQQVVASGAALRDAAATEVDTVAKVKNRAVTEGLVIAHELLQGRYSRVAGSSMIFAQALGVEASAASLAGLGLVAIGAGLGYLEWQQYQQAKAAEATAEAFALTGRGSQVTAAGIQAQVDAMSALPDVSRATAQALVDFDAKNAHVSATLAYQANQLVPAYVQAFGKQAPEALNRLKGELAELEGAPMDQLIEKFDRLNQETLNLTPAEASAIEQMLRMGETTQAVTRILEDLGQRGGVQIVTVTDKIREVQGELVKATADLDSMRAGNAAAFDPSMPMAYAEAVADAQNRVEGLRGALIGLKAAAVAAEQTEQYNDTLARSNSTLASLKDNASRARDAVAELHREMETRRAATPNDPQVQDYFANQGKYDKALEHREDPGDFKKPRAGGGAHIGTQMTEWANQWTAKEQEIRQNTGAWLADMSADEADYWHGRIADAGKNAQLLADVTRKAQAARGTSQKRAGEDELAGDRTAVDKAKASGDWAAETAALQKYVADARTLYNGMGREFAAVLDTEAQDNAEQANKMSREQADIYDKAVSAANRAAQTQTSLAKSTTEMQVAQAKQALDFGEISQVQYQARVAALHQLDTSSQLIALNDQLAAVQKAHDAEIASGQLTAEALRQQDEKYATDRIAIEDRISEARQQGLRQWAQDSNAAALQFKQSFENVTGPVVSSFTGGLLQMAEGERTLQQTLAQIGQQIVGTFIRDVVDKRIEAALLGGMTEVRDRIAVSQLVQAAQTRETALVVTQQVAQSTAVTGGVAAQTAAKQAGASEGLAVTMATAMREQMANAAVAAGGAYRAMAGIPVIGPELGAVAAAGTYAAVLALGSFDKGMGVVPQDMVAQIHQGERIIPRADNEAIMAAVGGRGGRGGDTYQITHSPTFHGVGQDVQDRQQESDRDFTRRVEKMMRRGSLKIRC